MLALRVLGVESTVATSQHTQELHVASTGPFNVDEASIYSLVPLEQIIFKNYSEQLRIGVP